MLGFLSSLCFGQAPKLPDLVIQKCSTCHPAPAASVMAKYAWPNALQTMVNLMQEQKLPITQAEMNQIVDFYLKSSPTALSVIEDDLIESNLKFEQQTVGELKRHPRPEVTSLKFADIDGDGIRNEIIVTDNLNSSVSWLRQEDGKWRETLLTAANAPVNTTPMDIDGDGDIDFGISGMGYMHPNERLIGEFHLLINEGKGVYKSHPVIKGGVPRITDCAPADYDGDGDMDIVIAMFGWRKTGRVVVMEQIAPLQFEEKHIFTINGLMRVIPTHLNDDDKIDFLALVTQQHEAIVGFINQGENRFDPKIIAKANHPSFGSSSIAVADLDQDGDTDILYTNGDMMDENPAPKPYHGVRWLENDNWNYTIRHLASMPGCYDAKPIDMDGDGDLDIVYSALYFQWQDKDFPSLAWLENTGGFRKFTSRKIAYAPTNLANIAVGDVNGDGKPDILGGGMHVPGPEERTGRLTLWLQK